MKKITMIKMEGCPYCAAAYRAIDELKGDYPPVELEVIDEKKQSKLAERFYDHYYVPSMYVGGKKIYEAQPGEPYEECLANVKKVFEAAS
ncbi:MAG: glutaredoxin family protein [Selenomonadaceae bacterium]|nr:glutaredoxin family protein [Selenomonadaceae bacterium]MBR0103401.1 glutaredoxin family protein [Selenomonadaceae bacterium]